VVAEHGQIFGQRVGRSPCIAQHAHDRDDPGDEQKNQTNDDKHDKHWTPLIWLQTSSTRLFGRVVNVVDEWR
jgi:hypothetical protein